MLHQPMLQQRDHAECHFRKQAHGPFQKDPRHLDHPAVSNSLYRTPLGGLTTNAKLPKNSHAWSRCSDYENRSRPYPKSTLDSRSLRLRTCITSTRICGWRVPSLRKQSRSKERRVASLTAIAEAERGSPAKKAASPK